MQSTYGCDQINLSEFHLSTALYSKMMMACPDEPLHNSSNSACGEYAEKAFYALPFHWAVLVQSVLDCGTMYNDTISSKMFFRGGLWFVCDYSNHSSSLTFRYLSFTRTVPVAFHFLTSFLIVETDTSNLFDNFVYPSPN